MLEPLPETENWIGNSEYNVWKELVYYWLGIGSSSSSRSINSIYIPYSNVVIRHAAQAESMRKCRSGHLGIGIRIKINDI